MGLTGAPKQVVLFFAKNMSKVLYTKTNRLLALLLYLACDSGCGLIDHLSHGLAYFGSEGKNVSLCY